RAEALLQRLLPFSGGAQRVGVSGVPGAGKSTLIEALGKHLTAQGRHVAVLAVDPSSTKSGGSILGDKTRMNELAVDPRAFIRPSPSGGSLGGVARKTRETLLLCEAAGYDRVLIETVGVGQSEALVAGMVDTFLVLLLAGAGDELQGIKRGILEDADVIAINKADGDNTAPAERARREYQHALELVPARTKDWRVPVVTCSALEQRGIAELWSEIERHGQALRTSGAFEAQRRAQQLAWMWQTVEDELRTRLKTDPAVAALVPALEASVQSGELSATGAARRILETFAAKRS
ncbi:MAG: methylmalonyl Co-A mutase-associated GTPase MeaB, partial [Polyangiaceae bacterium]